MRHRSLLRPLVLACALAAGPARGGGPGISVRPADPPAPERLAALRHWQGGLTATLGPVLGAWGRALRDLERWYYRDSFPGCRALARTLATVDPADLQPAPEIGLARDANALLAHLRSGASACLAGRFFESSYELGEARLAYLGLVHRLGRYGLAP